MLYEARKGCIKQQQKHGILCAQRTLCQMRHTTRDTHKFWDPKNMFPTKPTWLIAFAGELGDVVSRVLPHGIFDT